jgi:hypothetical protein
MGLKWDATYDVDGSGVPIFGTERGKAVCNLCPVLASNFVPTCEGLNMCFVDDDHPYVEKILGICVQALDDGDFRPFRGVTIVGKEDMGAAQECAD